jgi:hypothetical protein
MELEKFFFTTTNPEKFQGLTKPLLNTQRQSYSTDEYNQCMKLATCPIRF